MSLLFLFSCARKETAGKVAATAAWSYGNGLAGAVVTMLRGVHLMQHYRCVFETYDDRMINLATDIQE